MLFTNFEVEPFKPKISLKKITTVSFYHYRVKSDYLICEPLPVLIKKRFLRLSGAKILPDVGGRLLHGLSHRFRRLERLVSHTLGQESILAHSSLGGEPQGTVVCYFSDQVPDLFIPSFETFGS
jgi:hypothetical protein